VNSEEGGALIERDGWEENLSGIAIPYRDEAGNVLQYRLRRDYPELEIKDGVAKQKRKYLSKAGVGVMLYDPPGTSSCSPDVPTIVVEGEFKALATWRLAQHEADAPRWRPYGLQGVWCWKGTLNKTTTPDGGVQKTKGPIIQAHKGQQFVFIPDSNYSDPNNIAVKMAWQQLGKYCERMKATVLVAEIPPEPGINGIDDFIARYGPEVARAMIEDGKPFGKPVIRIYGGSLSRNVRETEEHLAGATEAVPEDGIYQRSGQLVRVAILEKDSAVGGVRRAAGSLQILSVTPEYLRLRMNDDIRFEQCRKVKDEEIWYAVDPPKEVAVHLLSKVGDWHRFADLKGIVQAPMLRSDGTLLQTPGFDKDSGLYFDGGDVEFPAIPEKVSREQAKVALGKLLDLVKGFPYLDEPSKSVVLAAILTPLCRHALRAAPMFAFSAPKAGSGKTLQAEVVSYIATGVKPRFYSWTRNTDEAKKRYLAILMEGSPVVVLDNVEHPIRRDESLCTILSQPSWSERILGVNQSRTVNTQVTWIATGNNLKIGGDLTRRTLLSSIDAEAERPDERQFDINLHEYVPKHRGELVAAALAILMAYCADGQPLADVKPYGNFEDWSRFVREPLLWLGCADPCETRDIVEENDEEKINLGVLLIAWFDLYGEDYRILKDVLDEFEALHDERASLNNERRLYLSRLEDAMRMVAPTSNGNGIDPRVLGNYISSKERTVEDGMRFESHPKRVHQAKQWRVCVVRKGETGSLGESFIGHTREKNFEEENLYIESTYNDLPRHPVSPGAELSAVEAVAVDAVAVVEASPKTVAEAFAERDAIQHERDPLPMPPPIPTPSSAQIERVWRVLYRQSLWSLTWIIAREAGVSVNDTHRILLLLHDQGKVERKKDSFRIAAKAQTRGISK
jgi:hypothetical protein